MRVNIVAEHKGRFVKVPISIREWRAIYDALYMPDDDFDRNLKLNKIYKEVYSFHNKVEWLIHDIIDGGRTYHWQQPVHHITITKQKAKVIKQKERFVLSKERSYIVKRPRWRKIK